MTLERRTFLKGSAAVAGGAALAGPFAGLVAGPASAIGAAPFRGLRATPDLRDGKVRLHLPEGFSYRSFHDTQAVPAPLVDGKPMPGRHDGMGAFEGPGGAVTLIRNHEVAGTGTPMGSVGSWTYDTGARGGCIHVDVTGEGEVLGEYTAINGTANNCSGGQMPWGAWVTCEETVNGPDVGPDFTGASNAGFTKKHGYVFEVPVTGRSAAMPITNAGRFAHEAVSFDPREGRLYLTEDNFAFPSGFYRYTPGTNPMESGHLDNDGHLQMLAVKGQPNAHLEGHQAKGAVYDVEWVDIAEPDPTFTPGPGGVLPTNDSALVAVGDQGRALGAAGFSRLEGQIYDNGVVYFTSTQGGGDVETGPELTAGYGNGFGQVWAYDTRSEKLRLVYQSPGKQTFDFPDNITVSDRGTLVVCEDSNQDNYIRGLNKGGQLWDIALNRAANANGTPRFDDEFAGSTFSPDKSTLFVNIQASAGLTFAIWGPWHTIGV